MNKGEYWEKGGESLRRATLCFLGDGDRVLLAMKKRGFGEGRWNGVGGKVGEDEELIEAAKREAREEIGVEITELSEVAVLDFLFVDKPEWDQRVVVFWVDVWEGEPQESEEMAPAWYGREEIPYEEMWSDDIHWLPLVLGGKKVKGVFWFGDNDEVLDMRIEEL